MAKKQSQTISNSFKREYGASGVEFFSGMIQSEEYLTELRGTKGTKIYDRMRRSDAQVRGTLYAVTLPIRQASWYLEPASDDPLDEEIAKFISDMFFAIEGLNFDDFIRQVLTYLTFGFSVFEKVYSEKDGKIVIDKIAPRLQKTAWKWITDKAGNLETFQQYVQDNDGNYKYIDIPANKLLLFTNDKEGNNFEGISVLRSAYKHWFIKDELYKVDALAHDRFSTGIPYFKEPLNANQQDHANAAEVLSNLHSREKSYVIAPNGWEFGVFEKTSGNDSIIRSIEHHNGEISKNILAQFINLGSTGTGSYALGGAFEELFLLSINAHAQYVSDVLNKNLIKELVDINYGVDRYPKLKHGKIILDMTKYMQAIASVGGREILSKDIDTENQIRKTLGLPELDDDAYENKSVITNTVNETPVDVETKPVVDKMATTQQAVKMSEKRVRRELSEAEKTITNIDFINRTLDEASKKMSNKILKVRKQQIEYLAKDALKMSPRELKASYVDKMQANIYDEMMSAYEKGRMQVKSELQAQASKAKSNVQLADKPKSFRGKDAKEYIKRAAERESTMMANKIVNSAIYAASQIDESLDEAEQVASMVKTINDTGLKTVENIAEKNVMMAYTIGRESEAEENSDEIDYAIYSAILDDNTCDECLQKDQVAHQLGDTEFETPNDKCFGGISRCRCVNIYVHKDNKGSFETRSKEDYKKETVTKEDLISRLAI